MAWRVVAVLVLFGMAGLAGCASKGAAPQDPQGPAVRATDTTGVVRGIVVDSAIRPLAGVAVREAPGNHTTKTDAKGLFGFEGLAPGLHFLVASKLGFATIQQSTQVEAGVDAPTPVRMQLEPVPGLKPYHDLVKFRGNQVFGVTLIYPDNPVLGNRFSFVSSASELFNGSFESTYAYAPNPAWEQNVVAWEPRTAAATELQADQCVYRTAGSCDDKGTAYANSTWGPSPLVFTSDAKLMAALAGSDPLTDDIVIWSRGTAGSVPDAGMTFDQDFSLITVHTYHYLPPDGYRFDKDGEPVDPPEATV